MSLAYTTVRRQAAELVDAGLLARGAEGFRVAESVFVDGVISYVAG